MGPRISGPVYLALRPSYLRINSRISNPFHLLCSDLDDFLEKRFAGVIAGL